MKYLTNIASNQVIHAVLKTGSVSLMVKVSAIQLQGHWLEPKFGNDHASQCDTSDVIPNLRVNCTSNETMSLFQTNKI